MHKKTLRSRTLARLAVVALGAGSLLALTHDAGAVGTRTFTLDTLDKLSGGDLKGVAVASDGTVRPGLTLGSTALTDATGVFSSLALGDGSVLVGTGPNGKIFKVVGEQATVFAETGALAVTSMVQAANGTIYAATMPDGKIFKVSQGKAEVFTTLPEGGHVWAIALDKAKTGLYAATGPEGKVFRVEANGTHSVYFKSEEAHLVSLAVSDTGEVYAGSSGKGILYKITGPGRATVLHDFPGEEVKAIALGKGGVVWAIGNEYGEVPDPPRRSAAAGRAQSGASGGPRVKPGKGTLMRFDANGRPERMMYHSEFHYLALSLDDRGQAWVGTGAEGRVYTVDDGHVVTLAADTDERQVGAVSLVGGKGYVVSGDPAVFHRVLGQGGADAVWTSKVLDAGLKARFGHLSWRSVGALEVSTRSGNTAAPDATWSGWSNPLAAPGPVQSPQGRYVQVRARWGRDPRAILSEVTLPFVTENLRPILLEVNAQQKGVLTRDSKETLPASGGDVPKHDTTVRISWKVENADNDPLRYRVAFRKEGHGAWRDVLRPDETIAKTDYDWDTTALSEGRYRVRVEASDEAANPPDQVLKHALESEVFVVDHTPPVIQTLAVAGRRVRARVTDGLGPVVRIEIAVDGKNEFRPLAPVDGVYDTADESVDVDVSSIVPTGSHLVTLRAFDAAGNMTTREVETN